MEWSEKAMWEVVERRKGGENRDERMRRICLPLLNSINEDLEFTAECAHDFENKRLPTLD